MRSLGYEENPPVPIDNKVILEEVWPIFLSAVRSIQPQHYKPLPKPWFDANAPWPAYNRYMTAMRYWAQAKGWTVSQLEPTMFEFYYPKS